MREHLLRDIVRAHEVLESAPISVEDARQELDEIERVNSWLRAEDAYRFKVNRWLDAERDWETKRRNDAIRFSDPAYAAARRGWRVLKTYVPRLEGVGNFDDLQPSLQFRYAAFAAAVLGELPPAEVKSQKQLFHDGQA